MSKKDQKVSVGTSLTNSQSLIWMSQRLAPDQPVFNMAHRFDLRSRLNPERFECAVQAVVDGSDALRTVFSDTEKGGEQEVLNCLKVSVPVLDFSTRPDALASASEWIRHRATLKLDLGKCPHDWALLKISENDWIWFLNIHHLVADAWSISLICRALSDCYRSAKENQRITAAGLPAYLDYRLYESEWQQSRNFADASSFWRESLKQPSGLVALYGKKGSRGASNSVRLTHALGAERSREFRELEGRSEYRSLSIHLTRFNLFATAVFAYLSRVGHGSAITIGTPAHNRPSLAFRETIGLFIETLPFSVTVDEDDTFNSLYKKVAAESTRFLRNAQPGCSNPSLSRQFNVVFNYINVAFGDFDENPMRSELIHSGCVDSGHDLRIQVHDLEGSGSYVVYLDVNTGTLGLDIRKHMGNHLLRVVDAFIADATARIREIDLASVSEKQQLIEGYNREHTSTPPGHLLDAFESAAMRHPDSLAVTLDENRLLYSELDDLSTHLADVLSTRGIGQGSNVGVCMRRSVDVVVALLAVMKSGAAFVPMEARLPEERLRFILRDASLSLVLCDAATLERGRASDVDWLVVSDALDALEKSPAVVPGLRPQHLPEAVAYILYTSGSTGYPKGVVVSHAALNAYISWALDAFGSGSQCSMPLFSSIGFDLTLTSMFLPLISGGTVVVYPETDTGADLAVLQVFEDDLVDVVKLTPAHLALVLEQDVTVNRVRALVLGGDNLETALCARAVSTLGNIEIYNEYGPTEAVVGCMEHRYDPSGDTGVSVPIGKPATHHRVYLLDACRGPVPAGVVGEIYIAGDYLSNGYLNRPEETAEKFLPDPFQDNRMMYRTGDLARFSENGLLEYLGRADAQLKIGGVRIESAEVKHAVMTFPGIGDCVVDVIEPAKEHADADVYYCHRCGLSSEYPGVSFDSRGICSICVEFESYKDKAEVYFSDFGRLRQLLEDAHRRSTGDYDCIMLLSGGKDSTYALYRLAEFGPRILALTLDNGFISEGAKSNIRKVVNSLGIDHRFLSTPAMGEIFSDSLQRHSNVCHGCFKTIYTLAIQTALKEGVPYIVTGLSRGQFFETRLTAELFQGGNVGLEQIEGTILEARKAYHHVEDAVSRCLDVSMFQDEHLFEKIGFIDFYRYCDVSLEEVYRFLNEKAPWIRPRDTGRSTNCLINDAGIYVHRRKEGYHNYALPYSWDVRMGHKTRDAALEELNDQIDVIRVHEMLQDIGYDEDAFSRAGNGRRLVVYFTAATEIDDLALREHVAQFLPSSVVPGFFVQIDRVPLTSNGKVDRAALPVPKLGRPPVRTAYIAPRTELENRLAAIWRDVLDVHRVGISDNFYALGGDSISAIQIASRANEDNIVLAAVDIFEHQTVETLAERVTHRGHPASDTSEKDPERFSLANLDDGLLDKVESLLTGQGD